MPEVGPSDLLGVWEIADELGVTKQAILMRRRGGNFPLPFTILKMGPVWLRSQIQPLKRGKKHKQIAD